MVGTRLAVLLLFVAGPAASQVVRGQLTDSITKAPLPGAFLTLVDAQGVERARTITNTAGEFVLTAPAAGTYRLRSKRIGFRPYLSAALTLKTGETSAFNPAVDPIPVALSEVVVSGERQCDIESGAAVAAVWDEVREALSAVSWTSRLPSYWYQLRDFRRELSAGGRPRGPDSTWSQEGYALNPIRTPATPAELDRQGFVVVTDTGWVYRGPDADVLLSDTFLRTHCFSTQAGRGENEGLLGLAFTSARDRTVPDITGTLWVDRGTAELRTLQFKYIRIPEEVVSSEAGGRVAFLRLQSGVWVVRDWSIRMPLTRLVQRAMAMGTQPEVIGFVETGGSINAIKTVGGAIVYGYPPPSVAAALRAIAVQPAAAPAAPTDTTTPAVPAPPAPSASPTAPATPPRRIGPRNQNLLQPEEFEGTTASDLLALVQQFRPNWLRGRGTISIYNPSAGDVRVYYNGVSAGDVNRLREFRVTDVRELRFLSAGEAQQRYGLGNGGGVIEVWSK